MDLVIVGGSDAGISAGLRARELDRNARVTVVVADGYPNFSICGIPYLISGAVERAERLAHRSVAELESEGITLRLRTRVSSIDAAAHLVRATDQRGTGSVLPYDALVVGTGATPVLPPITGLRGPDALGQSHGVHLLHTMDDALAVMHSLQSDRPERAVIVGAGYIGVEMAEALTERGLEVTQVEQLSEVLPSVDVELGGLIHRALSERGSTSGAARLSPRFAKPHRLAPAGSRSESPVKRDPMSSVPISSWWYLAYDPNPALQPLPGRS